MGKKAIVSVVVKEDLSSDDIETFEGFTKEEWSEKVVEAREELVHFTGGDITHFEINVVDVDDEGTYSPATVLRRVDNETNGVHISLSGSPESPSVEILTDLEEVAFDKFMRELFENLGYK